MISSSSIDNESTPSISLVACNVEDESKPLWKYVTKHHKLSDGGGNFSWQCNFCHAMKKSSYTRVRAHVLKIKGQGVGVCPQVTLKDVADMQILEDEVNAQFERKVTTVASLPPSTASFGGMGSSSPTRVEAKKRKGSISVHERSFDKASHDQLDALIARMFYSYGLPLHFAKNPHFISAITTNAANNMFSEYVPPGYNLLRTSLLQGEKENIDKLLQPIKNTWSE